VLKRSEQVGLSLLAQIGLLMGPFLSMMDSNIVNVVLPDIMQSLKCSLSTVQWVISGYLLALSAVLAASSYLAKRFGSVRMYRISMTGFTIGSALCAFAPNIQLLIAARILQGAFGAPLIPLAMGMLLGGGDNSKSKNIPPVMGMLLFLGPAIGPTIGGLLLHYSGWNSVFLINVPIGILGCIATFRIPTDESDKGDRSVRFDPVGLFTLSIGLTSTVYGTSNGPLYGWVSIESWPYWAAGGILLIVYVLRSLRHPSPAVDIKLFRNAYTALAIGLCALTSVVMFSIIVLVPIIMENIQQVSPLVAGVSLFPQAIVTGLGTVLGNQFAARYGVRRSAVTGMLMLTIGTVVLLYIDRNTQVWITSTLLVFRALAIGLVIQQLLMVVLHGLNSHEMADANTLFNVSERLGGAVGIALITTFLQVREQYYVKQVFTQMHISNFKTGNGIQGFSSMPGPIRINLENAMVHGFHETIWLLTGLSALGFMMAFLLNPRGASTPLIHDKMGNRAENV
jgi:EmrB/QacA subfamily drug resistance transporter